MSVITNIIYYIVPFIVLLGVLVFVHEFGHFMVARLLNVKVVAFSIGFGKKLWSRTDKKGTCWQLAAVPLGGYCQFLGDGDASSSTTDEALADLSDEDKKGAFALQPTWKKILIVVAGPLFNYLFAAILFFGMFWAYGKLVYPPVVGEVVADSAAEKAGIAEGDRIISINGNTVSDFLSLSNEIQLAQTNPVEVVIERVFEVKLQPEVIAACGGDTNKKLIGVSGQSVKKEITTEDGTVQTKEEVLPIVNNVLPESPADKAGLQRDDVITAIDGHELMYFADLKDYVAAHQEKEMVLQYKRKIILEVQLDDAVLPDEENSAMPRRRMLGVKSVPELTSAEEYNLAQAAVAGVKETYNITAMTLRGVWQMITGKRGGQDVGGIIRIAEMSGDVSKRGGLVGFIYFMALISVNLGLINLFPIPVLDGGNLVIFIIELLIGRELKPNVKNSIFKIGIFIVLALMVFATWNDVVHLISRIFK